MVWRRSFITMLFIGWLTACSADVPAPVPSTPALTIAPAISAAPTISVAPTISMTLAALPTTTARSARSVPPPTIAVAIVPTLPPIIVTNPLPSATPWPSPTPDLTLTVLAFDGDAIVVARHTPNYVTGCDVTLPPPTLLDTAAALQHFETGQMIWLQVRNEIWALIASPTGRFAPFYWRVLPNQWSEGMAESDPNLTPPPNRVQPVRGFGYDTAKRYSIIT